MAMDHYEEAQHIRIFGLQVVNDRLYVVVGHGVVVIHEAHEFAVRKMEHLRAFFADDHAAVVSKNNDLDVGTLVGLGIQTSQ